MNLRLIEYNRYKNKVNIPNLSSNAVIGKRVVVKNHHNRFGDSKGIIINISSQNQNYYGVKFNHKINAGHSCDNHCEYGYGYYINKMDMTFI